MWRGGEVSRGCGGVGPVLPEDLPRLQLLVCRKPGQIHRSCRVRCEWNRTGDQSAIVPPVEPDPRSVFPGLVLQVRRLVKLFVVVDAEGRSALPYGSSKTDGLWREEPRGHARHHYQRRESVELRHTHANCIARDLRIVPSNRKKDRRGPEDTEIVAGVRVLPDVVPADHGKAAERLLQAGMEVIAIAGLKWCVHAWN